MKNNLTSTTIKKNIHCPASYYFCSGYVPALAKEILQIINDYEKNSIYIKSIDMNNNTYNWLFRLFNTPIESEINPLTSTADNKYIYDYLIKIVSNSELKDGTIIFNIGE
jgi:hypothetical protein